METERTQRGARRQMRAAGLFLAILVPRARALRPAATSPAATALRKSAASALAETGRDEIVLDAKAAAGARLLDQLAFSHALQRHMRHRGASGPETTPRRFCTLALRYSTKGFGCSTHAYGRTHPLFHLVVRKQVSHRGQRVPKRQLFKQHEFFEREFESHERDQMGLVRW